MNYFDKYIKLLNDDSKKARQIQFFMRFSSIIDYKDKDHYLIDFYGLRQMLYEESGIFIDYRQSLIENEKHYILYNDDLFTQLQLPRTKEKGSYKIGQPFDYVDVYEYFTNLNSSDYGIFLLDFTNWLNKIWKRAKAYEEKREWVSPTSDQIQAIGTLFHTEFFQK